VYVPADVYVCDGAERVLVFPSPKFQLNVVVPVDAFVNVTLYGVQPDKFVVLNAAVGEGFIVSVITVSS
jgi:hypothetical protein